MFTVNEAIEILDRPGWYAGSLHRSLYVRIQRGDIPAKTTAQNGKASYLLELEVDLRIRCAAHLRANGQCQRLECQ